MTRLRLPLSSLFALSLAGAALFAPGCGNADDGGSPEDVGTVSQRATAGVVITEIAYDPPSGSEDQIEWIEVYNPGDVGFDITGGFLREISGSNPVDHPIVAAAGKSLVIPPKGYLVLGASLAAVHTADTTTSLVDGTYGVAGLNNTGDTITLLDAAKTTTYDSITYKNSSPWPSRSGTLDGVTIQLSATNLDADNNVGTNWCNSAAPASYSLASDGKIKGVGTPGAANQNCSTLGAGGAAGAAGGTAGAAGATAGAGGAAGAAAGAGGATAGAGGAAGATAGAGGAAGATAGAGGATAGAGGGTSGPVAPAPGDLVITEIMANPDAVGDDKGEWFEVLNVSPKTLELKGLVLQSDAAKHTIATTVVVAPGAYAIFATNVDTTINGGLPAVAYVYPGGSLTLANTADDIIIALADGTQIDSVSYASGDTSGGKSRSLSPDKLNATDNGTDKVPASDAWCHGTTTYGKGDVGTPGEANDPCGGGAGGAGGAGGKAGAGGAAGKAGASGTTGGAGKAGAGGTTGAAGKAGAGGTTGKAGSGGTGGSGGSGEAGTSATGGKAGTGGSGTAGTGGSGTAGKGGSSSAAGKGGSAGSSSSGKGGAAGKGGSTAKGGAAGKTSAAAGAAGAAGLAPEETTDSGCGCRTAPTSTPTSPASLGLAGLALALFARRKRS